MQQSILDYESVLISQILTSPQIIDTLDIPETIFCNSDYISIYNAVREARKYGISPDLMMIYDELLKADNPKAVPILAAIKPAMSVANARFYVEKLIEHARKVEIRKSILQTMEDLDDPAMSALDLSDKALESISEALRKTETRKSPSMENILQGYVDEIEERVRQRESGQLKTIDTGFLALDNLLGPSMAGDFVIIAARPGGAKTAFATQMADHIAVNHGLPTVYFSMEMTQNQMLDRFMALRKAATVRQLRCGDLDSAKLSGILDAVGLYHSVPIYIYDGSMTMASLQSRIRREVLSHGARAIFIDYLGLIAGLGSDSIGARWEKVGEASRSLKRLAIELKTTIFALVQLGRQSQDAEPNIADLKDSSALEADADRVMLLYTKGEYNIGDRYRNIAIKTGKNRNGDVGEVVLEFDGPYTRFCEDVERKPKDWKDIGN